MSRIILFNLMAIFMSTMSWADTSSKSVRQPNQTTNCPAVEMAGVTVKVEYGERDNEPVLKVRTSLNQQLTQDLEAFDPTVECLKLFYFPARSLVVLDLLNGQSGTSSPTKYRTLYVYQVDLQKITLLAEFPLERVPVLTGSIENAQPLNKDSEAVFRASYTTPELKKTVVSKGGKSLTQERVIFEIKDLKTQKTSQHSY